MLKCQVFKCSLSGVNVGNALVKTKLKSDSKTRFYAWKHKNAFLLYWWGDTTVCPGDMTVLGPPGRGDATVSVLQNPET